MRNLNFFKTTIGRLATILAVGLVCYFGINATMATELGGSINAYEWRAVTNTTINTTSAQTYQLGWDGLGQVAHFQYEAASDDSDDTVFVTLQARLTADFGWVTERIDTLVGTAATTSFTLNPDLPILRWSVTAQDTTEISLGAKFEKLVVGTAH